MRYNLPLFLLKRNLLRKFCVPCIALAFLLTACAPLLSTASSTTSKNNTSPGYLYTSPTNVLFVQWTNTNGKLSGNLQETYTSSTNSTQIQQLNEQFTGTQAGSVVNFSLSMFGATRSITGSLNGSTLTVAVPDASGQINTIELHSATLAQYNSAINTLEAQIQGTVTVTALATQTPDVVQLPTQTGTQLPMSQFDQQQAVTEANNTLGSALYALQADTSVLGSNMNLGNLFSIYQANWQQMQQYYQQEQAAASNGCTAYSAAKYEDGGVNYYLGSIQSNDSTLSYIQQNINMDITAIQQDMQNVQSDWQQLQNAVSADTVSTPTPAFSNLEVTQALQAAQNQITNVQVQLKSAQSRATQYDNEAKQLKQQADTALTNMHCS